MLFFSLDTEQYYIFVQGFFSLGVPVSLHRLNNALTFYHLLVCVFRMKSDLNLRNCRSYLILEKEST